MKILFIHKQILFPHDTGGKIRALNVLRHVARWHDVTYLSNLRPGEENQLPAMKALGLHVETTPARESRRGSPGFYVDLLANLASPRPFTVDRNYDPTLHQRAKELHQREHFDLIICDCVQMARHVEGLEGATTVLFQHNVEAQILQRQARKSRGAMARYMALQWKKMDRYESEVGGRFDVVIAVSEPDKLRFESDYGWKHVEAIDTAVDVEYFRPDAVDDVESPDNVVFVGSMDWLPNQEAVHYFVREVWPRIREVRPAARFQVVGRNPTPDIFRLDGVDGVEIVGKVADTRPYLAKAAVSVVPILVGGGTRLKIFEAMAMRKAVVSTTIGAEGLPLTHGTNVVLADSPQAFATEVIGLLESPGRRSELAASAHELVNASFGSMTVARQFDGICSRAHAARGEAINSDNRLLVGDPG